ncbi:PIN domain-containing protein [Candidatus Xianfuyuplasma coldseepsis]|uniref:DUF4935 domain-containing protein n=1 Tax=Candidatus Xianfuyuplasma coldseepsis TaxID=2782163 RepID=A0A7L7KSB2_9MOLU|nr:PIN domain-containing protein [Xianfuyuplasma coldseepsis]QMS84834.1 DUF4935 domain-containing protein [Xianfuyuplasma coldseepsis]
MENAIVIDTNFLIEQRKDNYITRFIVECKKQYDVFVPEIVVKEIKNIKARDIKKSYEKIEVLKEELVEYVEINNKVNLEDKIILYEKSLDKYIDHHFKDKVISYNKKKMLDKLLERDRYKLPPFNSNENASDKGFKDSMIWISLLEYFEMKKYQNLYFITSDKGFLNNSNALKTEFLDETNFSMSIIDGGQLNKLEKELQITIDYDEENKDSIEESPLDKTKPEINYDELRQQALDSMVSIFYDRLEIWNGDVHFEPRFNVYNEFSIASIKEILDNLNILIKRNWFEHSVRAEDLFDSLDIKVKCNVGIPVEDIKVLNKIYEALKDKNEELLDALIHSFQNKLLEVRINEKKPVYIEVSEDDLPF